MESTKSSFLFFLMAMFFVGLSNAVFSQSVARDTTKAQADSLRIASLDTVSGEIVLEAIEIKGRVEKPSVIIMPKRIEPEMGDVALERSFDKEVKEGSAEMGKLGKELNKVDRVKNIKKTVERKRK